MMYGNTPERYHTPKVNLVEFMHYQYLPVFMHPYRDIRLPTRLGCIAPLVRGAQRAEDYRWNQWSYVYLTVKRGYATPDNPINRPGWHCDGFGTDDINYIWWDGASTRFAVQQFVDINPDHVESMRQFGEQINEETVMHGLERTLYRLDPTVVHSTPIIQPPGQMRSFVKISFSNHKYNLLGNSHNHLFNYDWRMYDRDELRNDPTYSETDYVER